VGAQLVEVQWLRQQRSLPAAAALPVRLATQPAAAPYAGANAAAGGSAHATDTRAAQPAARAGQGVPTADAPTRGPRVVVVAFLKVCAEHQRGGGGEE
jgi:hypothetical protein